MSLCSSHKHTERPIEQLHRHYHYVVAHTSGYAYNYLEIITNRLDYTMESLIPGEDPGYCDSKQTYSPL